MDDKIKEVMGLVEEANYLSEKTRPVGHLLEAIESKLRDLVEGEKAEVERMRGALKGLVDLGMSGESVLFTAEYDRARDALGGMPS